MNMFSFALVLITVTALHTREIPLSCNQYAGDTVVQPLTQIAHLFPDQLYTLPEVTEFSEEIRLLQSIAATEYSMHHTAFQTDKMSPCTMAVPLMVIPLGFSPPRLL